MKRTALIVLILALLVACPIKPPRPTETANVCLVSGQLAGWYCPAGTVVERRYFVTPRPGEPVKPTTVCIIHHAPDPPVIIPQADQTEPRTGVDVYQIVVFPLPEIKDYLDALVLNGGSVIRVFLVYTWPESVETAGWKSSPYRQVGTYKETSGSFAGETFPVFDLNQWNEDVWIKWRAIFALCKERGIRITVSVFDGCSTGTMADRYNPFIMNHQHFGTSEMPTYLDFNGNPVHGEGQHLGGYFGGFKDDAGGTMKGYIKALLVKTVFELKTSGVDYRIGTNEVQCRLIPGHDQAYSDAVLKDWLEYWINILSDVGVNYRQIVLSIAGTHDRGRVTVPLVQAYGVIEQQHGPNSDVTLLRNLNLCPGTEQDGDGYDSQANGYVNEYGYREPGMVQCTAIRQILKDRGIKEFHIFNGAVEGEVWQNITLAHWEAQRALAGR